MGMGWRIDSQAIPPAPLDYVESSISKGDVMRANVLSGLRWGVFDGF